MRILIDLQGVQGESRNRGIGRYSLDFAKALVRQKGSHEILIVLSGLFPQTLEPIRAAFGADVPEDNIRVWQAVGPTSPLDPANAWRNEVAEASREAFLASLRPDMVVVTSPFEGFGDDAIFSIGQLPFHIPTAVVLYDLIPLADAATYLDPNPVFAEFYRRRTESLRQADLFLAISDSAGREAVQYLGTNPDRICNILAAVDPVFVPVEITPAIKDELRRDFGITKPFVFYSGATDARKNHVRLIRAYALMPQEVRQKHQLVFSGSLPEEHRRLFRAEAAAAGLSETEFVITGRISDSDMHRLYAACELFVFPSWHEGFGLPALEAMSCGAAVIASDTTSLPEVVDLDRARFDPFDEKAISSKMTEVLTDRKFLKALRTYGLERSRKFSWDETARRALAAIEAASKPSVVRRIDEAPDYDLHVVPAMAQGLSGKPARRLSDEGELLRQSACIARNCRQGRPQLLLDVSNLIAGDARSGVQRVTRSLLLDLLHNPPADWDVYPVYARRDFIGYRYARSFHAQCLGTVAPDIDDDSVVVYHGDVFFGLDLQHDTVIRNRSIFSEMRAQGARVGFLVHDLLPVTMPEKFQAHVPRLHKDWLKVLSAADGIVCVSRTVMLELKQWLDGNAVPRLNPIKLGWSHNGADLSADPTQGLPPDAETILKALAARPSFLLVGTLEPRKGHGFALRAMEQLWKRGVDVNLVIVGKPGWNVESLVADIRGHNELGRRLFWLDGASDEFLERIYTVVAALIAASEGEGFGLPVVEAAKHRLPLIARDLAVFREIAGDHATYFDGGDPSFLAEAIADWLIKAKQGQISNTAELPILTWSESARNLLDIVIGNRWQDEWRGRVETHQTDTDLVNLAAQATRLLGWQSNQRHAKRLYVDVSELVWTDSRSGIQRVTRAVLNQLFLDGFGDYVVTPVYAMGDEDGYRVARDFCLYFNGLPQFDLADEIISYRSGDIFLGLDLHLAIIPRQDGFLSRMRDAGVAIYFIVYDLLPIIAPKFFPAGTEEGYRNWLRTVEKADGVVCISRAVADEFIDWMTRFSELGGPGPRVGYFHMGSDIAASVPSRGRPADADTISAQLEGATVFLTVSTLEPRKGHAFVLDAFEKLWAGGAEPVWVIVGSAGWNTDVLQKRIRSHPQYGKRLFWLRGISDEYLEDLYAAADCLIFASEGEGFGLPIAEAYRHGLPVIARDLPVFREIAGDYPLYFKGNQPKILAALIEEFMAGRRSPVRQAPAALALTWQQSADQLRGVILEGQWYRSEGVTSAGTLTMEKTV